MAEILITHPDKQPLGKLRLFELNIPKGLSDVDALALGQRVIRAVWKGPIGGPIISRVPTETDPDRFIVSARVTRPIIDERRDTQLSPNELEERKLARAHYRGIFHPEPTPIMEGEN